MSLPQERQIIFQNTVVISCWKISYGEIKRLFLVNIFWQFTLSFLLQNFDHALAKPRKTNLKSVWMCRNPEII